GTGSNAGADVVASSGSAGGAGGTLDVEAMFDGESSSAGLCLGPDSAVDQLAEAGAGDTPATKTSGAGVGVARAESSTETFTAGATEIEASGATETATGALSCASGADCTSTAGIDSEAASGFAASAAGAGSVFGDCARTTRGPALMASTASIAVAVASIPSRPPARRGERFL